MSSSRSILTTMKDVTSLYLWPGLISLIAIGSNSGQNILLLPNFVAYILGQSLTESEDNPTAKIIVDYLSYLLVINTILVTVVIKAPSIFRKAWNISDIFTHQDEYQPSRIGKAVIFSSSVLNHGSFVFASSSKGISTRKLLNFIALKWTNQLSPLQQNSIDAFSVFSGICNFKTNLAFNLPYANKNVRALVKMFETREFNIEKVSAVKTLLLSLIPLASNGLVAKQSTQTALTRIPFNISFPDEMNTALADTSAASATFSFLFTSPPAAYDSLRKNKEPSPATSNYKKAFNSFIYTIGVIDCAASSIAAFTAFCLTLETLTGLEKQRDYRIISFGVIFSLLYGALAFFFSIVAMHNSNVVFFDKWRNGELNSPSPSLSDLEAMEDDEELERQQILIRPHTILPANKSTLNRLFSSTPQTTTAEEIPLLLTRSGGTPNQRQQTPTLFSPQQSVHPVMTKPKGRLYDPEANRGFAFSTITGTM